VLLIVPAVMVPIVVLGRRLRKLSRENQDWIAAILGQCVRGAAVGADGAGLHP
jgi:ATP-binding cassette, subfamily B, bacterial